MASAPRDGTRARQQPFVIVATTLFIMLLMHTSGVQSESSVTIKNVGHQDVSLHCKSGDDLGSHVLQAQQQIYWGFHASFFKNTKFVCSFQYINIDGELFTQDFAVWVDDFRHTPLIRCGQCLWNVDGTGFSLWDKVSQTFFHIHDWIPAPAAVSHL